MRKFIHGTRKFLRHVAGPVICGSAIILGFMFLVYQAAAQDIDNLDFPPVKDWVDGEVIDELELDNIEARAEYLLWAAPMPIIVATVSDPVFSDDTRQVNLTLPDMSDWMLSGPSLGLCVRIQVEWERRNTGEAFYEVGWRRSTSVSIPALSNRNDGYQRINTGTGVNFQGATIEGRSSSSSSSAAGAAFPYSIFVDGITPEMSMHGEYCFNTEHPSSSSYLDTMNLFITMKNVRTTNTHPFDVTFIVRPYFHFDYS